MSEVSDKIIQYIVVRKDLQLSSGKMAAQVAHASLGSVIPNQNELFVQEWLGGTFTKVVLCAKTFQQLMNLMTKLDSGGIKYKAIWDSCLTELSPETEKGTLTCIGIMPYPKSLLVPYLKKIQVY